MGEGADRKLLEREGRGAETQGLENSVVGDRGDQGRYELNDLLDGKGSFERAGERVDAEDGVGEARLSALDGHD